MKILVNGCSYVVGEGLPDTKNDRKNFMNVLLESKIKAGASVENIAVSGHSNREIFETTLEKMSHENYDEVYVGWTTYPRHHLYLGFEVNDYPGHRFSPNRKEFMAWKNIKAKHLELANQVLCSTHDHYETISILKYSKILKKLHKKIYFINVLANWSDDFFEQKKFNGRFYPEYLDSYTQQILDVESRPDEEIENLYNKQHSEYQAIIQHKSFWYNWLNLYRSARHFRIDIGNDNQHPGPLSYQSFGQFLISQQQKSIQANNS